MRMLSGLTGAALAVSLAFTSQALAQRGGGAAGSVLVEQCGAVTLHLTNTGLAFECEDESGASPYLFVVRDGQFPGRTELVVDILREANSRGRPASGRTRTREGLHVAHVAPDAQAQAICNRARTQTNDAQCREAVDVIYR